MTLYDVVIKKDRKMEEMLKRFALHHFLSPERRLYDWLIGSRITTPSRTYDRATIDINDTEEIVEFK